MLISVLTVCWNSERVLPAALASLRSQTYQPREWVVIDGGSTDGTQRIIRESGEQLGDWVSEPDTGIYNAMNKGIARAKGEILYFLNSDDAFFDPEVLADVASAFAADPALELLFGNVVYQYPTKQVLRTFAHINTKSLLFEDLCHQAVFARRTLFNRIGAFNECFALNADYDWLIRAFQGGAAWRRIDRTIALFTAGGAHMLHPTRTTKERHQVRMQYMSQSCWMFGDLQRRFIHRWHRHFRVHPLGKIPVVRQDALKVLLLSHGFAAEYELGFANGLARNGVAVTLVGSDTTLVDRLEPDIRVINLRGSQRVDRSRIAKTMNLVRYFFTYFAMVIRNRRMPIHVIGMFTTRNLWVSLIEAWLTRIFSGGYVLTVHNLVPHDTHSIMNQWLSRQTFRSADLLMVHTRKTAAEICSNYGFEPEKVVVVEHGIDRLLPRTRASRAAMRERLHIAGAERVVLFFGALARYKGVDLLLDAFSLPDMECADKLVIAGRCKDKILSAELRETVSSHKRKDSILWRDGYVDDADVAPLFHAADVLVMPYRHIDQSGVIFMALATGLRTVVTDVGSLRDYITPGFGAVAPVDSSIALAASIRNLLTTPADLNTSEMAKKFLWKRTTKAILPHYWSFME